MKLLTTPYASYLTGNELADAVMEYGLALSRRRDIDVVNIPVVDSQGTERRAQFTIGWQADTGSTTQDEYAGDLLDPDTVADLRSKADKDAGGEPFEPVELSEQPWPSFD